MNLKHRAVPFRVKEISDTGELCGHASVFDKLDWYRDVVRRGAFVETLAAWKERDALPPLLWQHDSRQPLGPHTLMREDEQGLYVEARLLIEDVAQAREAYALLKAKVIRGFSIGFDIAEDGMEYDGKTNVWNLTKVDLWENSIVTFPANEDALVEDVKAVAAMPPSEFEDLLRDAAGLSRKQAKTVASLTYSRLLRDVANKPPRDVESEKAVDLSPILNYLKRSA